MQNEQRNQRLMMNNPMTAQYQNAGNMMRANMPNGIAQNDLKRAALQNNRPYVGTPACCPQLPPTGPTQLAPVLTPATATATPWPA